jgi:hypothetical protein
MAVKAVVEWARALPGCSGIAVYKDGAELYSESIDHAYVNVLVGLLRASPGARRVSVAAGGFTFTTFHADGHVILVKVAGRFPSLPPFITEEPAFIDPSCTPALPTQAEARCEAEAALRLFGLL